MTNHLLETKSDVVCEKLEPDVRKKRRQWILTSDRQFIFVYNSNQVDVKTASSADVWTLKIKSHICQNKNNNIVLTSSFNNGETLNFGSKSKSHNHQNTTLA